MKDLKKILINAIENNDLNTFKENFNISNWKESIIEIENYAGVSKYNPEISYNDCDVFKYALHKNADSIFYYLLPLVDINKHGNNYGWPLLGMALKNNRYDYADAIINHPSFNPYPMYHTNQFGYIEEKSNQVKHIDFLFKYLEKFDKSDFQDKHLIKVFSHLICYNENTYERFNSFYQKKFNVKKFSSLSFFKDDWNILAQEILYNYFRPFILEKLSDNQLRELFLSIMDENIIFSKLFENEDNQAKNALNYLIKNKDLLQIYILKNPVVFSYLPLECLIFLENNKIDIINENKENGSVIDYVLSDSDLDNEKTLYFANKYAQIILNKHKKSNRNNNITKYCNQLVLLDKINLPEKLIKGKKL